MDQQLLDFLLQFSSSTIYLVVFGILLVCGLGLPIPEDLTLFMAGIAAYYGLISVVGAMIVAYLGVTLGDTIMFFLGAHFGRKLTKKWIFHKLLPDDRLNSVQRKFRARGNPLIFAARFMPGFRAPIFFCAGTLHLPYRVFLFYDGLAALISVPLIIGAVVIFGDNIEQVIRAIQKAEHGIAALIGLVVLAMAAQWYNSHRKLRKSEQ
ncbi:MAG: DedA family protein [Oligoflexia bacterium]|nr:DedA family protein [Oligoflexia bacterium]